MGCFVKFNRRIERVNYSKLNEIKNLTEERIAPGITPYKRRFDFEHSNRKYSSDQLKQPRVIS